MTLYFVRFLLNHDTTDDIQTEHFAWATSPERAVHLAAALEGSVFESPGDSEYAEVCGISTMPSAIEVAFWPTQQKYRVTAIAEGVSVEPI
jgi:hypothetical protein